MLKKTSLLIALFFVCATLMLSACSESKLQSQYDALQDTHETLEKEHIVLQNEYKVLQDSVPKMLYNPVLHSQTSTLGVLAQILHPNCSYGSGGKTFIVRNKNEFDALFTDEVKAAYNDQVSWYSDAMLNANEFADFDTDFPYSSMDFSKRMLVLRAYYWGNTGLKFMLDDVRMTGELSEKWGDLRTLHVRTAPVNLDHEVGAAETVRGLLLELDKAEFARVQFYTPIGF